MTEEGQRHHAYIGKLDLDANEKLAVTHGDHTIMPGECIGANAGRLVGVPGAIIAAEYGGQAYWYDPLLLIPASHHFIYAPYLEGDPGNERQWVPNKGDCWRTIARVPFDYDRKSRA